MIRFAFGLFVTGFSVLVAAVVAVTILAAVGLAVRRLTR